METKDRPENGSETSKRVPKARETEGKGRSPRRRWMGFLKRAGQKTFLAFKSLRSRAIAVSAFLSKSEGDVSPIDDIKGAFESLPLRGKGLRYILIVLGVTIYLLSGIYTVEPGEEAVARIFGKEVRGQIREGLHYRLPWPFEAIEKVNVMEIRRIDLGSPVTEEPLLFPKKKSLASTAKARRGGTARNQFLTGDENIIEVRMNIQYGVKDASDYLFNTDSPDSLVRDSARVAVTEIFGAMHVDDLLTVAKSQMQKRIARRVQRMLDGYGAGLQIINVNLQEVNPPKEVAQAFRDVSSAKEEREEKINKAHGYWNTVVPEARGKAHKILSKAEGYREEVVNQARGDAEKFLAMLAEYRGTKEVTEYRLYLETIEKILSKAKKFVIDSRKERVNLKFVK